MVKKEIQTMTMRLMAACMLLALAGVDTANAQTKPLYSWYSPSRGDNFATTDPRWAGRPGDQRSPDYRFVRIEGLVLSEARPGTRPLYSWYSPSRGDNFITSDPRWAGRSGDEKDGYRFVRLEGHVFEQPLAGTYPLQSFWDPTRADNFATSNPLWIGEVDDNRPPNYKLYRTEGHLIAAPDEPPPDLLLQRLGYAATPVRGERPLLVIQVEFSDLSPVNSQGYIDSLFFGASDPSVTGLYRSVSGGTFGFRRAAVIRVRFDEPFAAATANVPAYDREVIRRAAASGFNIRAFDFDRDGTTTHEELAIMVVGPVDAGSGCGGQTRGVTASGPGFRYSGAVSFTHENGDINLYAHELFHQLEGGEHIYGPGASVNLRSSFYAGNFCASTTPGPFHLDPWFKIRMGWLRPRVHPILNSAWSAVVGPADPVPHTSHAPIILFDPKRGFNEFFILEYRTPSGPNSRGYDAGVNSQGLAVWYVMKNNAHQLTDFNWPPPITGPYDPTVGSHMLTNFIIGSEGAWGRGPFWTASDGEFALRWSNGVDSGLRLKVGPMSARSGILAVQWRKASQPFLPRIDALRPRSYAANEAPVLTLDGMFPVDDRGLTVVLKGPAGDRIATLRSVSIQRLTAEPPSVAQGNYSVVAALGGAGGNAYPLLIIFKHLDPRPSPDFSPVR
jgi:M6 family metalloprotease-like protein